MNNKIVKVGNIEVANDKPFTLFGGMNVLESVIWQWVSVNNT
ncbi:2-dehydro-3-deoxyphosphooctonate aldolase [Actinobacillus pleuropneumoniae]|nr:2-dehydro-3-deoxyphosphooctonate aldolase [Actinobacillus pleuropneumoniae]KIE93873.1 2-dehydro-3-deoxyphosphooctonate aldolase [Actinobacillus pleuropneumoniae]KIE94818.1 2-dehydro-3-deoxyphosphooctonate aldolase [Actinobacillus pleuropneumoniae]KIF00082.1 2-dehydro-3-deoxyphosphooctonate aldolase [Actinobacillus pleuropneumoniae]